MVSTALVLLMTPALGLFYGGLVREKNVLSTLMYSFFTLCLVSVVWVVAGYTLSFGTSVGGVVGGADFLALNGLDPSLPASEGSKSMLFMLFQLTFAAITPALISGAFVERKRFSAFVWFTVLWSLLVYAPIAHWVWGGGWLASMELFGGSGVLDFAGGKVVHISSGVSALVCALVIGRRAGFGVDKMEPHNATLTVLGAALLWFGWFGFNGGSALGVNAQAVNALVTTNVAAATAAIVWLGLAWWKHKKPSVVGAAIGAVAGLVAITPGAGYVTPSAALLIGALTSLCCFYFTEVVIRGRVDDALDVFGVHGIGGIVGAVLTAVFATTAVPGSTTAGLLAGNPGVFGRQLVAVVAVAGFAALGTFAILKVLQATVGIRVSEEQELTGLDLSQHGEAVGARAIVQEAS
ncbi:MAG: ammonium transporter [Fimbriimonadaceae bacterium]|nr:ammonium transporter [Fimbriimonadaceae bacterium]QYK57164.1 MAG: ammonium transporter [Fimbriimonadaceae bacterium]